MKNLISILVLFLSFIALVNAQNITKITHSNDVGYAMVDTKSTSSNTNEQKMIEEINLVRKNPKGYASFVKEYIKQKKLTGNELAAANELIKELEAMAPVKELKYAACMFETAKKHAVDQAPTGDINHNDTKGNDPSKRIGENFSTLDSSPDSKRRDGNKRSRNLAWDVNYAGYGVDARRTNIQLLVDAGVPSRGHRKTILYTGFTHAAAFTYEDYTASGTKYDRWIQMFGTEYTGGASNSGTSGSSSNTGAGKIPTSPPAGCSQTQPGNIAWPDLIDGKKVSKDCWNYWWNNWKS